MPFTCTKEYRDIPFAHRQPTHDGHCALVHGHNWAFRFTFGAKELDRNGFVVDFGKLRDLKAAVDKLDHALVLPESDPELPYFRLLEQQGLARVVLVDQPSAEGLARHMFETADRIVRSLTEGRAYCIECVCIEDSKNYATYRPEDRLSTVMG